MHPIPPRAAVAALLGWLAPAAAQREWDLEHLLAIEPRGAARPDLSGGGPRS